MHSLSTPSDIFDLRCEYEVPRYIDLNLVEDEEDRESVWPSAERKQSTTGGVKLF